MTWHYLYDDTTGRLLTESSVLIASPPGGTLVLSRLTRAEPNEMWDETTRLFVPRPPKVLIDRLQDLLTDTQFVGFKTVWESLTPARKTAIRDALIAWLGRARFRNVTASLVIQP